MVGPRQEPEAWAPPTAFSSRPQSLYVCLPALLECPPFQTECRESWCSAPQLPEELRRVVSVYQAALELLRRLQVHPEIAAQVLAYLFFFSGTLLLNQLLDKGETPGGATTVLGAAPDGSLGPLPPWRVLLPGLQAGTTRGGGAGRGPVGTGGVGVCTGALGLSWLMPSPHSQEQALGGDVTSDLASLPPAASPLPCPGLRAPVTWSRGSAGQWEQGRPPAHV